MSISNPVQNDFFLWNVQWVEWVIWGESRKFRVGGWDNFLAQWPLGAGRGQGSESAGRDDEDHYIVMTVVVMVVVVVLPNLCLEILEKHFKKDPNSWFYCGEVHCFSNMESKRIRHALPPMLENGLPNQDFRRVTPGATQRRSGGRKWSSVHRAGDPLERGGTMVGAAKTSSRLHFLCVLHAVGEKIEMTVHWFFLYCFLGVIPRIPTSSNLNQIPGQ